MGNCAKYPSKDGQLSAINPDTLNSLTLDKYDEQPQDTNQLANAKLPVIDMLQLLKKTKVKNSPQKRIGVRFLISETDEILLPQKNVDQCNSVKWEIEENFQYFLTQYELRKNFLQIDLLSNGSTISTIKINMYLICIGPYHLDFEFPMDIPSRPRISLDFKVSQVVNMRIDTQNAEIYNMKEFMGEEYAFSIKTIFGNDPKVAEMSSIFKVDHQPKDSQPIAAWSCEKSAMPFIMAYAPFYQFHHATLRYIFYKVDKLNKTIPYKLVAECFISFGKLLGFQSTSIIIHDKVEYDIKNIELQQKLYISGKECGKTKLKIKFQIQHHLKQMLVCVRTEYGIVKASPVFEYQGAKKKKQITKQITQLQQISQKLQHEEISIQKKKLQAMKKSNGQSNIWMTRQSYSILQKNLEKEIEILEKQSKQTIKIYKYANEEQLMKGQNFLVKLGDKTLKYINQSQQKLHSLKWRVLIALLERGQFTLSYMGFDANKMKQNSQDFISRKRAVGLKLQRFQYKLLEEALKILGINGFSEQKKFAELFCAIGYFRIPQFREKLLGLIDKCDDPQITQWRGTDFSLKAANIEFKSYLPGENTFQILFDWDKYFYNFIKNQPEYQTNLNILEHVFQNKEWQSRISKRRGAFFAFIREWVANVTKINIRIVHSNWKHFPGYIQIIKSLMSQMKIRQVRQYPSSIKMACSSLLSNENLLNIFITIVFNKTNINNNVDVIKIMDLTNSFFSALQKQNKRIPSTFNYTFFYAGIKMVIENLYSYSTAKVLHLIYQKFNLFAYEFRIELCNYMLGRIFFKLFLHWSFNVRVIFHHVLVVRIYKFFSKQLKIANLDPDTRVAIRNISARYSDLLVILENVKKIKQKVYVPTTENQLYKKLKNTLKKRNVMKRKGQTMKNQIVLNQIPHTNYSLPQKKQQNSKLMSQLAKPKLQKAQVYDSQIISSDITKALSNQQPQLKKDPIIRKRINRPSQQSMCVSQKSLDQEQVQRKAPISMNTTDEVSMPILLQEDVSYINTAMTEFNFTSKSYLDMLTENKGEPTLKMEIMLDSSEMKPEEYNDVEEW